jgi:Ca2+-binding RTX toxin-like protein
MAKSLLIGTESKYPRRGNKGTMRLVLASFVAGLGLLGCLPAVASPATAQPSPSCATGPVTVAGTTYGTPCGDVIVVPPGIEDVKGGGGNDVIVPAPIAASESCPDECRLGVGSQTFEGGPGNDVVFGERGNDILRGGEGNDRLYGGIGDDLLEGGPGNDLLSGGFGADGIDGGPGNDFVRGDATQDEIVDTGPATDVDTLSYATGVTPGFGNKAGYPDFSTHSGFPGAADERGVYLNLAATPDENGDNSGAPNGGGVDSVTGSDFERIIGSPFADYIVGSKPGQEIFGGGGADVLIAGGSGTSLDGGADGDDCVGGASTASCESTAAAGPVVSREKARVSVGAMTPGSGEYAELYLVGSSGDDQVTVGISGSAPTQTVSFHLTGGSVFDQAASASAGCTTPTTTEAVCALTTPLDSVLVAGMNGNDSLSAADLPSTTSLVMLGGEGNDTVSGGDASDDTLVDGPGDDVLYGHAGDDALVGNGGHDELLGEAGNDLFLSTSICEGDVIDGGEGRDNASWAKFGEGVEARLDQGGAGRPGGPEGEPQCGGASLDSLRGIEDLEGSSSADTFYGDAGPNQLLGHLGADTYYAGGGEDTILANSADYDPTIDCGEGLDTAIIDRPPYGDVAASDCEEVFEADPNNFRKPTRLPAAVAPVPAVTPRRDVKSPQTKITLRPAKLLEIRKPRRRVVFRFASSERGSSFRCKLDHKPFRPCRSPRIYSLGPGQHSVRVAAVDAAGNVDPTPAVFAFRIRRR